VGNDSKVRRGPSDGSALCAVAARPWVLLATILGSSMAFIDGTVVNVALPALQRDLRANAVDLQWVVEAYALFLAALLLVGGALGDRFGRRRIYAIGIAAFALASAWCGLAGGIRPLILARSFQGIAGALLVPGSLAILSASFPADERGRAIGTWSGSTAITAALGPVLGGWLVDHVSWRAAFFINLPLAAAVLVLVFRYVPESRDRHATGGIDVGGALLATAGLGSLVYGLIESSRLGFGHSAVIATLVLGVLLLAAFAWAETHLAHPMVPPRLFGSSDFTGANLLTLLLYAALGGALFFLPMDLIQVHGYSATAAGAAFLPFIVLMSALSRWSGGLVARHGPRLPLVVGPTIAAAGFALFAVPGTGGGYVTAFLPALVVLGLGMAVTVAPLTTTVMNAVAEDQAGIASGINNAVSRTAGLLGLAVFGIVMVHSFAPGLARGLAGLDLPGDARRSLLDQASRLAGLELPGGLDAAVRHKVEEAVGSAFVGGFRRVMGLAAVLALLSAAGAALTFERRASPRASRAPLRTPSS
jgi:EmrB/QacA subfamily drug resistance transporter